MRIKQSRFSNQDNAVSPVIGVILMVAITVILAAVIAVFVLGIGEDVQEAGFVGVNVEGDGTNSVTVTLLDAGNADNVYVAASGSYPSTSTDRKSLSNVGSTVSYDGTVSGVPGTYNVVAEVEGEYNVVQSFEVTS